jgi:hypothetical protein
MGRHVAQVFGMFAFNYLLFALLRAAVATEYWLYPRVAARRPGVAFARG